MILGGYRAISSNEAAEPCEPPNGYPRNAPCLVSFLTRQESDHGHLRVFADVLFDQGFLRGYFFPMSTQQLTSEAMALPISERVSLAQALWQSIDAGLAAAKDREAIAEAIRRDEELSSGEVQGRTHEEVMRAARRAIGCA